MPADSVILTPIPVAPDEAGSRLDKWLSGRLPELSRTRIQALIAGGRVAAGGATVADASVRVKPGQAFTIDVPPDAEAEPEPQAIDLTVVYEDDDLVVVDKPAGLVVHPGAGNPTGTLVDQLVARFPDMAAAGPAGRAGVVHRLDKGTSGLLVVARTAAAREGLVAQMAARSARRRYLAVAHGLVEADEGLVDAPLGRSPAQRLKMAVVEGGRQARTGYRVLGRSSRPVPVTLLACRLETGRTHQVRAHLAAIGHPLAGDDRYGRAGLARPLAVVLPELSRPWLHAAELGFVHPLSGEPLHFSSPLPLELARTLPVLGLPAPPAELP